MGEIRMCVCGLEIEELYDDLGRHEGWTHYPGSGESNTHYCPSDPSCEATPVDEDEEELEAK